MDENATCRVCGSAATEFLCRTPMTEGRSATLSHRRCGDCGSVFVGTRPTDDVLADAYGSFSAEGYYERIGEANDRKLAAAVRELGGLLPRDAALLDLGTGDGRFVQLAHEAGFTRVSAHEIPGADVSRIRGIAAHVYHDFDYASVPDAAFDCVVLLDVAEHVSDVPHLFRACRRILKPGGIVYIHTPVVTRVDRLMHRAQRVRGLAGAGRAWQRGRTSIFHLQNYTPRSLRLALGRAGFADVDVRVVNELSWPVHQYVRVYLLERNRLPLAPARFLAPLFHPLLATRTFNANKAVVTAR